jgi:hypothetical protein
MAVKAAPKVTRLVKADRNKQIWISKPRPFEEIEFRPPFGSTVKLETALGATAANAIVNLSTYPLIEDIPPNTTLSFTGGTVVTTVGASKDDLIVPVKASAAITSIAAKATANISDIETVVTLASDVAVGDEVIDVSALEEWVEKGRVLTFATSKISVTVTRRAEKNATKIYVKRVKLGSTAAGEVIALSGDMASIPNYEIILSANSVNRTGNAQVLTDYVYASGEDALKDVTTADRNFAVSGKQAPNDPGLQRVINSTAAGQGRYCYFVSTDPEGGFQWSAQAVISTDGDTGAVNQYKDVNFTVEVNGRLYQMDYPHLINY